MLLAENPYFGGINSHILALLDALKARSDYQYVPAVLQGLNGDDTLIARAADSGWEVHTIPLNHRFDARVLRRLRNFVRENSIDLVHVHGYRGGIVASFAVKNVPIVMTSHGVAVDPPWRTRIWQRVILARMKKMAAAIAVSAHVADWLDSRGVPKDKISVVHNGLPAPAKVEPASRAELSLVEEDFVVLFCGRLVDGKGLRYLLEAVQTMEQTAAVFVGDGPLRSNIEQLADQLELNVRFTGRVADPWPYYRMADALALPAEMEAFPTVLIEAASQGLPVVASDVGGTPEIVNDGHTGFLVPPNDANALRDALSKLKDRETRSRIGAAALQRYKAEFTPEKMAARIVAVYNRVLA